MSQDWDASAMLHAPFQRDGVTLHYVSVGRRPLVKFLHGFPDYWETWRDQMLAMARAGYLAVALDMRGYHESDKPQAVREYRAKELTAYVSRLLEELGAAFDKALVDGRVTSVLMLTAAVSGGWQTMDQINIKYSITYHKKPFLSLLLP